MGVKISQLTTKTGNLAATDLVEIAEVSGLTYVSKKVTGQKIIDAVVAAVGSTITVGSTDIASGTIGSVLFQGASNKLQQSANFFWDNTNNALGLGASPLSTSRLDIRAKDGLSTSQSFRVRNSIDSLTQFEITGEGRVGIGGSSNGGFNVQVTGTSRFTDDITLNKANHRITFTGGVSQGGVLSSSGTLRLSGGGSGAGTNYTAVTLVTIGDISGGDITATSGTINVVQVAANGLGNQVKPTSGNLTYNALFIATGINTTGTYSGIIRGLYYNPTLVSTTGATHRAIETTTGNVIFNSTSGNVAIGGTSFGTSSDKVLAQYNGTAPGSSPTDAFQLYSADIVGGNAAPHFRTENGNIVKLYQETTGVGSATVVSGGGGTNMKTDDTFDGYTLQQVVKALRNLGILA